MKRLSAWARVWVWVALLGLASSLLVPGVATAAPTAPLAAQPKQIVLIDGTNKVLVLSYAAGLYNVLWNSGTISGWQTGWTNLASGDFNGDGDQEIVATRYDQSSSRGQIKVFDPVLKGGAQPVDFSLNLSSGMAFHFLATGDFEGLGRDQIVASYTYTDSSNSFHEDLVEYYPTDSTGRSWGIRSVDWFGTSLRAMTSGDLNRDGLADLAMVRNADRRLIVESGQNGIWSRLFEDSGYCCNWNALAIGKVLNDTNHPDKDLVLARSAPNNLYNSMVFFWWSIIDGNSTMTDLTPDPPAYYNSPSFSHIALANLDGNVSGFRQIVALRELPDDSGYATTPYVVTVNPAGANITGFEDSGDYGANAWNQVAAGDLNGDGRDEVVLLRANAVRVYDQPWANAHHLNDLIGGLLPAALAVANIGFDSVLSVSPAQLTFNVAYGSYSDQAISIGNVGGADSIRWTASKLTAASWLKLNGSDTASGTTPGTLRASVDAAAAGVGTKNVTVRIQTSDGSQVKDVPVTVTVPDPGLYVAPSAVTLWRDKNAGTTTVGTVSLSRPTGSSVSWSLGSKPAWLTVSPMTGTATSQVTALTLQVDPAAQEYNQNGVYRATLWINPADASVTARSVQVTFIVTDRVQRLWMPIIEH